MAETNRKTRLLFRGILVPRPAITSDTFAALMCSRNGLNATGDRLSDKHVARMSRQTVGAVGLRPELSKAERLNLYSGHSLRVGLASSAEVDER
jgi:hypothetical protein